MSEEGKESLLKFLEQEGILNEDNTVGNTGMPLDTLLTTLRHMNPLPSSSPNVGECGVPFCKLLHPKRPCLRCFKITSYIEFWTEATPGALRELVGNICFDCFPEMKSIIQEVQPSAGLRQGREPKP